MKFSVQVKKHIQNMYNCLTQFMVKRPMNYMSYFFAHGLLHCFLLVILVCLFFIWENKATTSQIPVYHHVNIELKPKQTPNYWKQDSIKYFWINVNINSDSLKKEKGYTSSLEVSYMLQDFKDTIQLDFTRYPYQSEVDVDTIRGIRDYTILYDKDSIIGLEIPAYGKTELPLGGYTPSVQRVAFMTNDLVSEENNPYYYFDFGVDVGNFDWNDVNTSGIFIQVGDIVDLGKDFRTTRSLRLQYIYPQPSYIRSGVVAYLGDDLKRMMANRKIVLQAEDVQLKNQDERKGFVNSVLLGALLGFILTVVVEIFSKWKRMNDRAK